MCGFTGFFSKNHYHSLSRNLTQANKALIHRGPDGSGHYFDDKNGVGLGHRRLSIIDLSQAGSQPIQSSNGKTVIVYNGEIYNFKRLKKELSSRGYEFTSQSDTEVVLSAFIEWGTDCFKRFVGMFALAIWDQQTHQIILCRDRLGIKPLYYYLNENMLLFGSELKSLMGFEAFPRHVEEEVIPQFLHFQYIPAPHTIFKNTRKLLPGHFLQFNGHELSLEPFWKRDNSDQAEVVPNLDKEEELTEELDHLLTTAVSDRLVSDVPIGALLSGGIDSSLVVALMQKVSPTPIRTFSIGFDDRHYNEAPWAKKIADHLGTDHTEMYIGSDEALNTVYQLSEIYDEPFADSSGIPSFIVSKLTKSHVTVALSGDGGDELFAGYVRYWMTRTMFEKLGYIPYPIRSYLAKSLNAIPGRWVESGYNLCKSGLPKRFRAANLREKWRKLILQLDKETLSELYRMSVCVWTEMELKELLRQPLRQSLFDSVFLAASGKPTLSRLMAVDQSTYLPDCMLTKVDRASMANGLEVRVPILDHRVVEFSSKIPDSLKLRDGNGKYILKKVLERYVPPALFERPKMGFAVPIDIWLRGPLKNLMLDYLSPSSIKAEGLFQHSVLEKMIGEHLSGEHNHHHRLWAVLMWEMWRERWLS